MWTQGEEEGGTNWEISVHRHPTIFRIASGKLLCSTGSSAWCFVMTLWGGMVVMGGRFI